MPTCTDAIKKLLTNNNSGYLLYVAYCGDQFKSAEKKFCETLRRKLY